MKFLHNENYGKEIKKVFSNNKNLDLAVAFFGKDSFDLFKSTKGKDIRVICNLQSGACNPFLIEKIIKKNNIQVKTNQRLHAKTLIQKDAVIIGSANISSNGLSLEGSEISGWIETGILTSSSHVISSSKSWFESTWTDSIEIANKDLEVYKKLWLKKRNHRCINNSELSIIEAATNNIDTFHDRKIYFAIYRDNKPSDEAIEAYEAAKASHSSLSEHIDFFEEWSDLPDDSHLISIYVGRKYGVYFDGIYKTHHNKLIEKFEGSDGKTSEIILCFKEKEILGYKLTSKDKDRIKTNIKSLMACREVEPGEAFLVPLAEGISKLSVSI